MDPDINEIKELLKHEGFKIALKKLALKINELDTVRNINANDTVMKIGLKQLASSIAIETIEIWLDEIFGISNDSFRQLTEEQVESEDNIIKRLSQNNE